MTDWFKNMHELVASYLGVSVTIVDKVLWSVLAVLVYLVVRRTLVVILNRRLEDASRRYIATKTLNYLLGLFLGQFPNGEYGSLLDFLPLAIRFSDLIKFVSFVFIF